MNRPIVLLVAAVLLIPTQGQAFDGFDFPVGYPNGSGWNNGSNCFDNVHCDNGDCTGTSGGLFFLERYTYPAPVGCVLHPGEDWNKNGGGDGGLPIHAIGDGQIIAIPQNCSWGTLVIRHDNVPGYGTLWSVYGHMDQPANGLGIGSNVIRGDIIGLVADKGTAVGNYHLHLEIRKGTYTNQCDFPQQGKHGGEASWITARYLPPTQTINSMRPGSSTPPYHCTDAGNTYRVIGHPGDILNGLYVKYKNIGTSTWNSSGDLGDPNYVELKTCDYQGIVTNGWFTPVGWIAPQRVTTCDETTVPPSQAVEHNATFTFSAQIPTNAATTGQDMQVWFRPAHGDVAMEDWGGVNILVQVLPPTDPSNLTVSPTGCSQTNSFAFTWNPSSAGASGIKRYHWNINGVGDNLVTGTTVSAPAPSAGGFTFSVRAEDNAGNLSGYAQTTFCYQPSTGPCTGREIPHSCVTSAQCYPPATANLLTLPTMSPEEWQAIGQPVHQLLQPGKTYSIGFEYRSQVSAALRIGLGSGIAIAESALPASTSEWHSFWSAPFMVSMDQVRDFAHLRFVTGSPIGIEMRNVQIWSQPSP